MLLDIIQQEIYTGSINTGPTHVILLSLSPSAPYLATWHLSLQGIGCKHIPSSFAFPVTNSMAVCLGGLGVTCSPRDPRFAGSNLAEVDGFFQDVKILSTSPPGGTLNLGSRV